MPHHPLLIPCCLVRDASVLHDSRWPHQGQKASPFCTRCEGCMLLVHVPPPPLFRHKQNRGAGLTDHLLVLLSRMHATGPCKLLVPRTPPSPSFSPRLEPLHPGILTYGCCLQAFERRGCSIRQVSQLDGMRDPPAASDVRWVRYDGLIFDNGASRIRHIGIRFLLTPA